TPVGLGLCSCAVRILPLRLAQQSVVVPRLATEPTCVGLRFVPAHAYNRVPTTLGKAGVVPVETHDRGPSGRFMNVATIRIGKPGVVGERRILVAGDLELADSEGIRDFNAMLGSFFAILTLMWVVGR